MQLPQPEFDIGTKVLTTKGIEGKIIGYYFYKEQLHYLVNHLIKKGKYNPIDITAEEIEKIISLPTKIHQFRWSFGQSINKSGAVLCGIKHYRNQTWYYIDYPYDPYLRNIFWHKMP